MAARSLGLAATLLALAVAGCLQPAPSAVTPTAAPPVEEALAKLGDVLDATVALPDGLTARGTVFLPEVAEGARVPVLLDLGPYYDDTSLYDAEHPPNLLYAHFLARGYAIALVALRGTGQSDGCFPIGGPQERADAAAIVEWLASQAWSNGNVAMTGVSYDGSTPWEAAVTGTPSLKAIIPVEGITDMYRYTFFEGVPFNNGGSFWPRYMLSQNWAYTDTNTLAPWVAARTTSLCPEAAEVALSGPQATLDPTHGPFWDARDTTPDFQRIQAATFVVHGFQDWNVRTDEVQAAWSALPEPKRMLLGQWQHNIPWRNSFNRDWDYEPYNATVQTWLDAHLRDDAAARTALADIPPVRAQDSAGRWWNLTAWPPVESKAMPFHLTSRGLDVAPQGEASQRQFQGVVPSTPYATSLGFPIEETRLQAQAMLGGAAGFRSATLTQPLMLLGNPMANLTVSVDRPGGHLAVTLLDIDAADHATLVTWGYLNLAQREGRDKATDVPVNQPFRASLPMYAAAHVFEAGHRLELVVQSDGPDAYPHPLHHPAVTVHLGGDAPSVLEAPVFQGALPPLTDP